MRIILLKKYSIIQYNFLKDLISLVTNRGLDSLVGIIIIPYLISKIGEIEYGRIVLAQAVVYLGVSFINYGFDIFLLKKVPTYIHHNKIYPISILISRIIQIRFLILLLYFFLYIIINCFFVFSKELNLYISIFSLVCFAEVLSTSHLLVAFHNVKILPYLSAFRFIFILFLTCCFVTNSADSYKYIIYYALSFFITNIIILFYVFIKYNLHFHLIIKPSSNFKLLIQATPYFISRVNLMLSDKLYNILSATFISLTAAALLDISLKILSVIIIPIQILSVVILGRYTIRTSKQFIKKILFLILIFSTLITCILIIISPYILKYYSFSPEFDILITLGIIIGSSVFSNLSIFIGENIMVTHSLEKKLIRSSVVSSSIVFPILLLVLAFFENTLLILSLFFLIHKIIEFLLRIYYSWDYIKS